MRAAYQMVRSDMALSLSSAISRAAMIAGLCVLSACAVPDLGPRPQPRLASDVASARSLPPGTAAWPQQDWWAAYADPQLSRLMTQALVSSPDVAAAAARFARARGLAQQAGAATLPRVDGQASVTMQRQSLNNGFPEEFKTVLPRGWNDNAAASIGLDFDLDLWGRNRAALAAATSDARAAEIDMAQARLMLTTAIADAYADLARLHAQRDIAQSAYAIRASTRKLVDDRVRSGLDTRGDLRQAEAGLSSAQSELAAADEAIALRRNQIAALVGAGPDLGLDLVKPALVGRFAADLPTDVDTNLIGRRPDIASARARVEAAASRIKVARADFFPALNLSALIGVQSLGVDLIAQRDSIYGNAGPAISLPIFRGGALAGQYRGARGSYDEAVANYDRLVIDAYREVADAVTSRNALLERASFARNALTQSEEAYSIARKRYQGGLSTFLDVLVVEERLLAARRAVAELDMRGFALDISLIRALGGGFVPSAPSKDRING